MTRELFFRFSRYEGKVIRLEKKDSLRNISFQKLILKSVVNTRQAACDIPEMKESKNGNIRVTYIPLCELAEDWIGGGLSMFSQDPGTPSDICERELNFKIHPAGSHTMQFVCPDGHIEPVNCYGFSALKVAYYSFKRQRLLKKMRKMIRYPKKYFREENGYTTDKGTVCATIWMDGQEFMRIYWTVSGAQTGEDDERCALVGMRTLKTNLEDGGNMHCGEFPMTDEEVARRELSFKVEIESLE